MKKNEILTEVKNSLEEYGFIHLVKPEISINTICKSLGVLVLKKDIRIDKSRERLYHFPDEIPYHSDHPIAKVVIWKCMENEKGNIGALNLIDLKLILGNFKNPELFKEIYLSIPNFYDIPFDDYVSLIKLEGTSQRVFYAERLGKEFLSEKHKKAFNNLGKAIKKAKHHSINMMKDDILIIDNHRMIHGRKKLSMHSKRHLVRYWLKNDMVF